MQTTLWVEIDEIAEEFDRHRKRLSFLRKNISLTCIKYVTTILQTTCILL